MHIERFGTPDVDRILTGRVYVFPKIDGTNGSVWADNGALKCGSRNRVLSLDNDNAGFAKWVESNADKFGFLSDHPNWIVYGEYLIRHTVKYPDYRYENFYVFDVFDTDEDRYLHIDDWEDIVQSYGLSVIPIQALLINASLADIQKEVDMNHYLLDNDSLVGEGIVIKNYDFVNIYGRQCYAKIVRDEFKASNRSKRKTAQVDLNNPIEKQIVEKYATKSWITHEYLNYCERIGQPTVKETKKFLGIMYNSFLEDWLRHIIKTPAPIDFREVNAWFNIILKGYVSLETNNITLKE